MLDVFGDLADERSLCILVRRMILDSLAEEATQVTASTGPEPLRREGSSLSRPARCCWRSPDPLVEPGGR